MTERDSFSRTLITLAVLDLQGAGFDDAEIDSLRCSFVAVALLDLYEAGLVTDMPKAIATVKPTQKVAAELLRIVG